MIGSAVVSVGMTVFFSDGVTTAVFGELSFYISLVIFAGAGLSADFLWNVADVTMGGMTIINIPVIFILSKYALRALKDYEKQRKEGKEPTFRAKDIGIPDKVDYWN